MDALAPREDNTKQIQAVTCSISLYIFVVCRQVLRARSDRFFLDLANHDLAPAISQIMILIDLQNVRSFQTLSD